MRTAKVKKVSYPRSITKAVEILADGSRKALPLSGGVSFIFSPLKGVEELVSLRTLPLNYIRPLKGGLEIGATTLISELVESKAVENYGDGILREAARRIGSTLNRNLITVGGNLVQPFIWSDLPTVALALGAKFHLRGKMGRTVEAADFFAQLPRNLLKPGEILTEISFPPLSGSGFRTAWRKFALTENDFAILKLAVVLNRRGRLCREITIVAGGGTVLPQRLFRAETVLTGKKASQSLVNQASDEAGLEIELSKDIRCSEKYKRDLTRALLRGILEEDLLDLELGETWKLF